MSIQSGSPAVPMSLRYQQFFNAERMQSVPESLRPTAQKLVNAGQQVIASIENETLRLQVQEGAVVDLVSQISLVAMAVILTCVNPTAMLLGAAAGVANGDRILRGVQAIENSSPLVKLAVLVGCSVATCFAAHASCIVFSAIFTSSLIAHTSLMQRVQNFLS